MTEVGKTLMSIGYTGGFKAWRPNPTMWTVVRETKTLWIVHMVTKSDSVIEKRVKKKTMSADILRDDFMTPQQFCEWSHKQGSRMAMDA